MNNTQNTTRATASNPATNPAGGNGDMLGKGVDYAERKAGHEQVCGVIMYPRSSADADCVPSLKSHATTEKISDGVRKGFKKLKRVVEQSLYAWAGMA